jgi:hypothetical protein
MSSFVGGDMVPKDLAIYNCSTKCRVVGSRSVDSAMKEEEEEEEEEEVAHL